MSRLSEILGVKERQEFRFRDEKAIYRINGNIRQFVCEDWWSNIYDEVTLCEMIAHPELIHPLPEKPQLTDQQITAIKGRIAEGTPWAARDKDGRIFFYDNMPYLNDIGNCYYPGTWGYVCPFNDEFYDFITFENSPVYLPELLEGSEKE